MGVIIRQIRQRKKFFFSFMIIGAMLATAIVQGEIPGSSSIIREVPTTHKVVALTIDDGPHEKTTPEILKVLKEKQAKVTFFLLAANVEHQPDLVRQEVAEGHEIGTHAYSHTLLNRLSAEEAETELANAAQIISNVAPPPKLFRPPGGVFNKTILAAAQRHGYTTVTWSVDPEDWKRPTVNDVVQRVLKNVKPGSIVLLHDGQYPLPTPEALSILIDRLREEGYQLVTVSELLQYYENRP